MSPYVILLLSSSLPFQVWFYDGSVTCFERAHLALALFSVFSLFFLALLIPVLTVIAYHRELSTKVRSGALV